MLLSILTLSATIFLIIIIIIRSSTTIRRSRLPLGNLGWPFIGETIHFISSAYSDHPESFMEKRRLLYGNVFMSHLFGTRTIVSTDAEVNKVVLQSEHKAFVPFYPKSLTELMGNSSILLINGTLHRRIHGLIGSFFKSSNVRAQITTHMEKLIKQSISTWSDGQLLYIQDQAKQITFQVLVRTLIGLDPGEEMEFLRKQFQEFIAGLMSLPVKFPGSRLYKSLKAKKKMVEMLHEIIKVKRSRRKEEVVVPGDIMDVFLSDQLLISDEMIADNMIDFMIPGEDSVPLLITLAIKYLSDCPTALQQLKEENMKLKRSKEEAGEPLCWTDYLSLRFTQMVICETLRMGNIIVGVMRKATRDVEIKGYLIPKGCCVFTYFRSVHLDHTHYHSPYRFNPWRWQDHKDISNANISFTPFGAGQRLCPGLDLARLETSIFLYHFVTQFRWVAEADSIVNFPTVRMKRRMPVLVTRRDPAQDLDK
ncbi:cytochrome P450 90D2 [Impatiens glandulifera]|uniref:cytochrome P450 90D2 n=1 Tax=Impatiens glandulifera TaxID=253017 RepID=UPI001FB1444F|nr:cytochrome P450 90D2 [Impatiens glandulifera]